MEKRSKTLNKEHSGEEKEHIGEEKSIRNTTEKRRVLCAAQ